MELDRYMLVRGAKLDNSFFVYNICYRHVGNTISII